MTHERCVVLLAVSILSGCPEAPATHTSGSATTTTASVTATSTVATTAPTGNTAQPATPTTPPVPTGPVTFDHFAQATPPAANPACPPLPKGGAEPTRSIAATLRRLSCEPALFYKPVDALRTELALPPDQKISFAGPSAISLDVPAVRAVDLAKALGEPGAQAARGKVGAWSFRMWRLTAKPDGGALDRWSPGRVSIDLAVSDPGMDIDVTPLGDAMTRGSIAVSMPPSVLPLKDDDGAAAALVAGIERIAADRKQLEPEPEAVATRVGLADERFRVSRRAIGTGDAAVKGIDVWSARTRIGAAPVIEKLGLRGKIEPLRATDTDDFVLYDGQEDEHAWRGVKISLRFAPRDGGKGDDAASFVLTGVTVMP